MSNSKFTNRYKNIATLKYCSLAVCLFMVGVMLIWPLFISKPEQVLHAVATSISSGGMHASKVSHKGQDSQGHPFDLTAEAATQDAFGGLWRLKKPLSTNKFDEGIWRKTKAENGIYDAKLGRLDLEGEVIISDSSGWTIITDAAKILMNKRQASGNQQVIGNSDDGLIRGEHGFIVEENGKKIIFKGPASAVINEQ